MITRFVSRGDLTHFMGGNYTFSRLDSRRGRINPFLPRIAGSLLGRQDTPSRVDGSSDAFAKRLVFYLGSAAFNASRPRGDAKYHSHVVIRR